MSRVREVYRYKRMTASGVVVPESGGMLGGFICTTTGTLQIIEGVLSGGSTDIVSQIPVTAGQFYPIGLDCPSGAYAVLASSAVGTFLV